VRHTYFATNGTSTANKIVTQSLVAPGDIVLLDRNCHQSHHYGMMLAGANVVYLEAYPVPEYTMSVLCRCGRSSPSCSRSNGRASWTASGCCR
jgi:arginine/lysine/ornithine decarboxylase